MQYNQYERSEVYAADTSRVVTFLNSVKDSQNLQKEDIRTNSRTLTNGMILNIRDQYFEVHFNNDFSAYTLSPINLVNPNVTVIDKEDKLMDGYTLLGLKLAMGIIGLVLQINLMGKGNLAPTSAMDQVQNYVLGGIIGGVIYSDSIGVFQFSLVLVLWTLLVFTLRFIKNHNQIS